MGNKALENFASQGKNGHNRPDVQNGTVEIAQVFQMNHFLMRPITLIPEQEKDRSEKFLAKNKLAGYIFLERVWAYFKVGGGLKKDGIIQSKRTTDEYG